TSRALPCPHGGLEDVRAALTASQARLRPVLRYVAGTIREEPCCADNIVLLSGYRSRPPPACVREHAPRPPHASPHSGISQQEEERWALGNDVLVSLPVASQDPERCGLLGRSGLQPGRQGARPAEAGV